MMFRLALTLAVLSAPAVFAEDGAVLQRGKVIERELAGGQEHLYRIPMATGEYAGLSVDQRGIDVVVQALGPDGKSIADFDAEARLQGPEFVGLLADAG